MRVYLYLLVLLVGGAHALIAEILYSVTDLGALGGSYSTYGNGINNAGQVTGYSTTSSGAIHAFLYSNGQMTDLGTLGGNDSEGYGLNNAGQVTGYSNTSTGQSHAFLYSNGQSQIWALWVVPRAPALVSTMRGRSRGTRSDPLAPILTLFSTVMIR